MLRRTSASDSWRREAKATALLAAPMVLTNLAQSLIHATDVVLLGRVGPDALAAAALGVNLYVFCLIFGMGMMTAAAPMIARERGRRPHSVRDVRRTVRQAMWTAILLVLPMWVLLWNARDVLVLLGQDPALSADAQTFVRHLMWALLPAFLYLVLRNFLAALERPFWALVVALCAVVVNAAVNYCLIFGVPAIGLPALGLVGAGIGSSITVTLEFLLIALIVTRHRRFRRYRLFGRFWRADWARFREVWKLGFPIAITLTLEVGVFNAAVFLMGSDRDGQPRRPPDRDPDRLALLHGADGPGAGGHRARRRRLWSRRPGRHRPRRLDQLRHGCRLHVDHGAPDVGDPARARLDLPRYRRSQECRGDPARRRLSRPGSIVPDRRRSAGGRRRHAARAAGYDGADDLRAVRLLGGGHGHGGRARLRRGLGRGRHLVRARRGLASVAVLMLIRWSRRERLGLVPA
jgi:hypothetical protein